MIPGPTFAHRCDLFGDLHSQYVIFAYLESTDTRGDFNPEIEYTYAFMTGELHILMYLSDDLPHEFQHISAILKTTFYVFRFVVLISSSLLHLATVAANVYILVCGNRNK